MKIEELQTKVDTEARESRIKLNFLSKSFNSLAQAYHEMLRFTAGHREIKYSDCEFPVCKSNHEVYVKLGVNYDSKQSTHT